MVLVSTLFALLCIGVFLMGVGVFIESLRGWRKP